MIEVCSDHCVIDWLHSASEGELPKGQKILADIGRELHEMEKRQPCCS